ncbi:head-tail connector protein [Sphingomonas sp. UYP23]
MIDDNGPGAVTLGADDRALAVAAVKAVLRVASSDEDALIAAFAESALGLAEQFTAKVLIVRTLRETLRAEAGWQLLGAAPVLAIIAVDTTDGTALAPTGFAIDIDAAGDGWVRVAGGRAGRAVYDAGLAADWADLPAPVRQGVVLLAAYLFDARDTLGTPPAAVTALWRPFRRMALGGERAC